MKEMLNKLTLMGIRMKLEMEKTLHEERGDVGIKQLAMTVGIIIVIGAAVLMLKDNIGKIIEDVWKWLFEDVIQKIGA